MNKHEKTLTYLAEATTEIYMPVLQFTVRMSLAVLAAIYFYWLPIPALIFTKPLIFVIISSFILFHLLWWRHYRLKGAGLVAIRLSCWVDLMSAVTATLIDPFPVPPMMLLILIAVLGNGIQHGLKIFLELLFSALGFIVVVFLLRRFLIGEWPSYSLCFFIFLLTFCLYYSYMLIRRIEHMKKEAEEIGEHDALTGLLNRRAFAKSAKYLLSLHQRTQLPLVIMFADLDDFKRVNDNYGHEMGDKVLQRFSNFVKEGLRKTDITARYGGDEFVFILTDTSVERAEAVALRLQTEFTDWSRSQGVNVGISFGLVAVPNGRVDLEEILRHVDAALYEAKQEKGRTGAISVLPIVR
jgi:diguanylate cyclase (GGDEF)-like protein